MKENGTLYETGAIKSDFGKLSTAVADIGLNADVLIIDELPAQKLIEDKNISVEEIASTHGFESAVYFRRLFKKFTGKTPTEYRRQEFIL